MLFRSLALHVRVATVEVYIFIPNRFVPKQLHRYLQDKMKKMMQITIQMNPILKPILKLRKRAKRSVASSRESVVAPFLPVWSTRKQSTKIKPTIRLKFDWI